MTATVSILAARATERLSTGATILWVALAVAGIALALALHWQTEVRRGRR